MIIYAHREWRAEDAARRQEYRWAAGQWHNVRDEFADYLVAQNRDRLCIVPPDESPARHKCELTAVVAAEERKRKRQRIPEAVSTMVEGPPLDTAMPQPAPMRMSAQRRHLQRAARRRSLQARRNVGYGAG